MTLNTYIWVALFSIIYTSRMLGKPGISKEIKVVFLWKNIFYTFAFIFINSISLASTYRNFLDSIWPPPDQYVMLPNGRRVEAILNEDGTYHLKTIDYISFFANLCSGLILAIVRSFEPYFIKIMKRNVYWCFGAILVEEDDTNQGATDTYSSFINSSLNIELVHIILEAITVQYQY